jgi:PE family
MSLVVAIPDVMAAAATDLANIGTTIRAANAAAATQTTGVFAAAEDEVSTCRGSLGVLQRGRWSHMWPGCPTRSQSSQEK